MTAKEQFIEFGAKHGFPHQYVPETTIEALDAERPAMATSTAPKGIERSVEYRMELAAFTEYWTRGGRMYTGVGTVYRENDHDEGELKMNQMSIDRRRNTEGDTERLRMIERLRSESAADDPTGALMNADAPTTPKYRIRTPSDDGKTAILNAIVGGHYEAPKPIEKGDVAGLVQTFLTRNETFLPSDSEKLQRKLLSLLPAQ